MRQDLRAKAGPRCTPNGADDRRTDRASPTVVSLAAVTWDFGLVGRTRMLTEAWLRLGHPTLFVQVPSYRTALQRMGGLFASRDGAPVIRPWPTYPSRWWLRVGAARLTEATRRRAAALRGQLDRHLEWDKTAALVVSPVWAPWLEELPFRHVIYDCIDELEVHVRRPELADLYHTWEEQLVRRASGAVVTAERLGEALRARRPDLPVRLIRNGVDVDRFQHLSTSCPRPRDVPATERPVVGFVGALYEWIDWDMIRETARRLPDFDFVFVGPQRARGNGNGLAALPNVRFLGARPYDRVPAYLKTFDVCWIPFRQNDVGAAANPVKMYEYLALGKPVVTTPVADTDSFGRLIDVVRSPTEMAGCLRTALETRSTDVDARIAYARQNEWNVRAREYVDFLTSLGAAEG